MTDLVAAVQGAVACLRTGGAVTVPRPLGPWVRQTAVACGMRVRTIPAWAGRVRIEAIRGDENAADA